MGLDLIFTTFAHSKDNRGKPKNQPWGKWVSDFSLHSRRENKDGEAVILGEVTPRRGKEHVKQVFALGLDFDRLQESDVEKRLRVLSDFEHFIYTTYNYGIPKTDDPPGPIPLRVRVIVPLAEPLKPHLFAEVRARFDAWIPGSDTKTKDITRLFFLPSCPLHPPLEPQIQHGIGKFLTPSDLPELPSYAPPTREGVDGIRRIFEKVRKESKLKPYAERLCKGEAIAEDGTGRHQAILDLTFYLAGRRVDLACEVVHAFFLPSISQMPGKSLDEVWNAYTGAVVRLQEEHNKVETGGKGKYTPAELATIASTQGCTVEDLRDRWLIQADGGGWFLDSRGQYRGPFSKNDIDLGIKRFLAKAPVKLMEATTTGYKFRGVGQIIGECGTLAEEIISDLTRQTSWYDSETMCFYEAVCSLKKLEPRFEPQIDEWLKILAGPQYSKLVDWMSVCADLHKLSCALYFDGPKGSGKTLFAFGMAKLWTEDAPAELASVMDNFNEELLRCPLIIADEEIPKKQHQTVTTTLRSMLSTTSRTLKRKYKPTSNLRGSVRLILTANNEFLLDSRDVASAQDLDAIAQRFLYIRVPPKATEFLESLPRETKEAWGREGIARHATWLAEHHTIAEPGKRFWVEGDVSTMHRLLMTGSYWNSLVCEWLVRYLGDPQKYNVRFRGTPGMGYIRRIEGRLFVNVQAISDGWELYLNTRDVPNTRKLGTALNTISKTNERVQKRWDNKQIYYREIDVDYLMSWSQQYNVGEPDEMTKALQGDAPGIRGDNVIDMPVKKDQPPEVVGQDKEGNFEY